MAQTVFHPLWAFLTDTAVGNAATILGGLVAVFGVLAGLAKWLLGRRARLKLETIYLLSHPSEGNTITVINNSSAPILVSHWELVWRKRWLWQEQRMLEEESDFSGGVLRIEAHGFPTLSFVDGQYFQWGQAQAVKGKLYLKLWIAGRRGFKWLMVYDPSK